MRRSGRGTRALVIAVVAATTVVGAWPAGARAQAGPPAPTAPTAISVDPSTGIASGQQVQVTVDGSTGVLWLAQCRGDVAAGAPRTEIFASCGNEWAVVAGPRPVTEPYAVRSTFQTATGRFVTCQVPPGCVVGVTTQDGAGLLTTPIEFAPGPVELVVDRRFQVREGDALTATVVGPRDADLAVALCEASVATTRDVTGGPCGPSQAVPAGADPAQRTIVADRTFVAADGSEAHCAPNRCVVAAASADGSVFLSRDLTFVPPSDLVATPSRGLADGDRVGVRGVSIGTSYDGPPFWVFPVTGQWQFAQCDARVGFEPTLLAVFTHCAAVPEPGPVDVPTREVDLGTVTVRSSVAAPLGQVTDCTSADGACVLALVRLTQFGTVEAATTPLSFGAIDA